MGSPRLRLGPERLVAGEDSAGCLRDPRAWRGAVQLRVRTPAGHGGLVSPARGRAYLRGSLRVRGTPARARRHAEIRLRTVLRILAGLAHRFSRERAVALMVA
jgi:hypothetical protein